MTLSGAEPILDAGSAPVRSIRVGVDDWLIVDDVIQPRYLIHHGPALYRPTGETLMMYRVERWALRREQRQPVAWFEYLAEAEDLCRQDLDMPDFRAPARDQQGRVITPEEQRRRWEAGLDPRSGHPRVSRPGG
jgi:hypothetical protein